MNLVRETYKDLLDPTHPCPKCKALMWWDERIKNGPKTKPHFSWCCSRGKVVLPYLKPPPKLIYDLLHKIHPKHQNYTDYIRQFNMMYAFTSMAGHQDDSVNNGRGPYTYRLGGQNYHLLGSLLPVEGKKAKFSQLYMFCGEDETQERIDALR